MLRTVIQLLVIVTDLESASVRLDGLDLTVTSAYRQVAAVSGSHRV